MAADLGRKCRGGWAAARGDDDARRVRGDVEEDEIFGEGGGLGEQLAVGREDEGGAVEDELVVAADLVGHDDEGGVATGDGGEHLAAESALAVPEGRRGDVEDEAGMLDAGQGGLAHWRISSSTGSTG